MIAITADGLIKRFREVQAVADVSFQVHEGELFGFLGPNGAGKTTTINMPPAWPGRTQARSAQAPLTARALPGQPNT